MANKSEQRKALTYVETHVKETDLRISAARTSLLHTGFPEVATRIAKAEKYIGEADNALDTLKRKVTDPYEQRQLMRRVYHTTEQANLFLNGAYLSHYHSVTPLR